jgi:hypothetical protein
MSAIITSDLIEALSQCRRKAFLTCRADPIGVEHEYVQIMRLRESDHRGEFRDSVARLGSDSHDKRARLIVCPNGLLKTGICGPTVMPASSGDTIPNCEKLSMVSPEPSQLSSGFQVLLY